jgi:cytochrome P450
MSATEQEVPAAPREGQADAAGGLPAASVSESVRVLVAGVVPALVRGLFSPGRLAMKLLTQIDADSRTISILSAIRRKYDGDGIRLLRGRVVVLWGARAIHQVLDNSAYEYASDSGAKAKGMSHFQPDALTLSHGDEWEDRRAFNEAVLASREQVHPDADRFLAVVDDELRRLHLATVLQWSDWERLFDHVTLRVIFGDRARDEQRVTDLLEKLMGEANRLVGLSQSDDYYELYGALERQLRDPPRQSLIGRFAEAPHTDRTRVVQQIPHWMFAMRDTLGINCYRALAAIVADPEIEQRVRQELEGKDLSDPAAVDGLRYLGGCLQEAMRLWPTSPLLARETTRETTLAGERLKPGTQVMMLNVFNHRDPEHVEDADALNPERWADSEPDYRFNHLSNGSQDCPGAPLVLLLGKALIAGMLERYSVQLAQPRLDPGRPLPHTFDFYETRFIVGPRGQT